MSEKNSRWRPHGHLEFRRPLQKLKKKEMNKIKLDADDNSSVAVVPHAAESFQTASSSGKLCPKKGPTLLRKTKQKSKHTDGSAGGDDWLMVLVPSQHSPREK